METRKPGVRRGQQRNQEQNSQISEDCVYLVLLDVRCIRNWSAEQWRWKIGWLCSGPGNWRCARVDRHLRIPELCDVARRNPLSQPLLAHQAIAAQGSVVEQVQYRGRINGTALL